MDSGLPFSTLSRAVDSGIAPADLLPELHREVLGTVGASASAVLQKIGSSGDYLATSGHGVTDIGGPWLKDAEARTFDSLAREAGIHDLTGLPTLRDRLKAQRALVIPIAGPSRTAHLVIAGDSLSDTEHSGVIARARVEFALAIELAKLARERALRRRLQELFLAFSRGVSATQRLRGPLDQLSHEANALFGTRRTSVWLHHRRERELVLAASSDPAPSHGVERVSTDDTGAAAARGLRLDHPLVTVEGDRFVLIAPLRGWRRALGTIVVEGEPAALEAEPLADQIHEFSRELSIGLENVQLFEDILRQRRLLEDTFNSLVDLVVVTDNNLLVAQMNEAFAARVGGERDGLLERSLHELIGADMSAWVQEHEPGARARSRQFADDRLGGTFSATVTPLITQEGDPVGHVLVARDITTQVQLEGEREALRGRLAQSEKLASLGQFVAGIAHEMNNPLQGVMGHLELLAETSEAAKPIRKDLRRIYQEADRAAKIVRNLLVFAGSQRMTRRRIAVDRVLSRAIASREAAFRRGHVEIVRSLGANLPPVVGDSLLLQQAFLNILINAEHAVADQEGQRRIQIATSACTDTQIVTTSIHDSGGGIPADVLPRIFDPFFTTKEVGKGTGLGLAITYGIIQEHGGTIRAANALEGGAVFTIELPAAPPVGPGGSRAAAQP